MNRNTQILRAVSAGVMMVGMAAPAMAQGAAGGFDKPLSAKAEKAAQPGSTSTTMMQMDGANRYELRIVDGEISAKINGKKVPADRIVKDEDGVKLLDEDGAVVQRFQLVVQDQAQKSQNRTRWRRLGPPGGGAGGVEVEGMPMPPMQLMENPPKVMVGINMAPPTEELSKHYGVQPSEAILVDKVIDGLAADRAGIRSGDLITEIDGKKPATPELLREVLGEKEPGDTVAFTVMRKGGNKAIRVKLDEYDASKLGPAVTPRMGVQGLDEEAAARLQAEMKRMQEQFAQGQWAPGEGNTFLWRGGEPAELFVDPRMKERMADLDRRMSELDERLAKLGEQMSKIESMMEKLSKQNRD